MDDSIRIENLEKEIAILSTRVEELEKVDSAQPIIETIEKSNRKKTSKRTEDFLFVGVVLVILGSIWLAKSFGWFCFDLKFWPSVLIILGIYYILKSRRSKD